MQSFKRCAILCAVAMLALNLAGCQSPKEPTTVPAPPASSASSAASSTVVSEPSWETKVYEDTYLKYELPANWEENPQFSNEAQRLVFFVSSDATTAFPSNVNVQVTSLDNASDNTDYSAPKIQKEFHDFLLTEAGLPSEAKDGVFTATKLPDYYVYSLSFPRPVEGGQTAQQTVYMPMGLDYSVMIWATDWNDGVSPSVEEVAMQICQTLTLVPQ